MERKRAAEWLLLGTLSVLLVVVVFVSVDLRVNSEFMFNTLAFVIGSTIALSTLAAIFIPVLRPMIKELREIDAVDHH